MKFVEVCYNYIHGWRNLNILTEIDDFKKQVYMRFIGIYIVRSVSFYKHLEPAFDTQIYKFTSHMISFVANSPRQHKHKCVK